MTKAEIFRMAVMDALFFHLLWQQLRVTDVSNPLMMVGVFVIGWMFAEMILSHARKAMAKDA